jgi:tRNA (guanine-N7-)-methyltransferase
MPLDWSEIFGNANPVDLEIGIGNGSFLVPFAKDHPERNMVGLEIAGEYVRKADKKLIRQNIPNAKLMIGDAKLLVWKLFADEQVENIYINYPDPWFKKRHKKRRLINPFFLRMLAAKMKSDLTVATDDAEYRDFVVACIREVGCFENLLADDFVQTLENYYSTKYEKKWKSQGKDVFYMKFRKLENPAFIPGDEYIETQNLRFALDRLSQKPSERVTVSGADARHSIG